MKKIVNYLIYAVLIVGIFFLLNYLLQERIINRFYGGLITLVCINIILAVSLNLITGFTGQLCLGHAGFMSIGAYTAAILTAKLQYSFPVGLLAGGILAAVVALIVGLPTLKLKGDYFAITTLGVGEIIRVILTNIDYTGGPRGFTGIPPKTTFTWAYFVMVAVVIIVFNIIHSAQGRSMIAVRENEIAAEAMGVNTARYKVTAFIIAAFLAGVGGGLYAHYSRFLIPSYFDFMKSIEVLTFVVFGGMGSLSGSIIASGILTFLPELLRPIKDFRMIIYSIALIVLMIFRPQGLLGTKEISLSVFGKFLKKESKEGGVV
jgi:branched-chain amino acid transport system permease protein